MTGDNAEWMSLADAQREVDAGVVTPVIRIGLLQHPDGRHEVLVVGNQDAFPSSTVARILREVANQIERLDPVAGDAFRGSL